MFEEKSDSAPTNLTVIPENAPEVTGNIPAIELTDKVNVTVDSFMVDFPEGGFRAWATMIGAWVNKPTSFPPIDLNCRWNVMFVSFGMTQAFGVFQDYYARILLPAYTPSQISWIGSVQICFLYGCGILTGFWYVRNVALFHSSGLETVLGLTRDISTTC